MLTIAQVSSRDFGTRFQAQQAKARDFPQEKRPRYIGCTDAAEVREAVCKSLARAWPGGRVDEFWSVAGSMAGLDCLVALRQSRIEVASMVFFDCDRQQLLYAEVILELVRVCPSRERFVGALFGRSLEDFGRYLGVSNMLDFLDLPCNEAKMDDIKEALPTGELKDAYAAIFDCVALRQGWPLVWPFAASVALFRQRAVFTIEDTELKAAAWGQQERGSPHQRSRVAEEQSKLHHCKAELAGLWRQGCLPSHGS